MDRTRGTNGCPYCGNKKVLAGFNDLASIEPEIAAEWHPTLNGALTPEMVTAGSNRKVWWLCPDAPSAPETSARSTNICIFLRRRMQNGGAHETEFF